MSPSEFSSVELQVARWLKAAEAAIGGNQDEIARHGALKRGLMQQLLTGKVRVKV